MDSDVEARLARLEAKLDIVVDFAERVEQTAARLAGGKFASLIVRRRVEANRR